MGTWARNTSTHPQPHPHAPAGPNAPIHARVSSISGSAKTLGGRRQSFFWRIHCSWVETSRTGTECFASGKRYLAKPQQSRGLGSTYEGLKLSRQNRRTYAPSGLGSTYEGLKR